MIMKKAAAEKKQGKAKNKKKVITVISLITVFLVAFWYFQNFTLEVSHTKIESEKIKNEIIIAHITDLHGASFGKNNKRLIKKILSQNPDIAVVTGDMYDQNSARGRRIAEKFMADLNNEIPVYFVSGEADRKDAYCENLSFSGINVMNYKKSEVTISGNEIEIYGIDNAYFSPTFDLKNEWASPPTEKFSILLAHIPNYFPLFADWGADITFSGDTHGGFMRFPFLGPLIYQDSSNLFPKFTFRSEIVQGIKDVKIFKEEMYDKGLFETKGKYLYVSGGLGHSPFPCRLFNRPEIAIISLSPKS